MAGINAYGTQNPTTYASGGAGTGGAAGGTASGVMGDIDSNGNLVIKGDSNLEMDDFLALLAAQMGNQDPMNPTSDTDFIAQMAQFSSLQAMQTLTELTLAQHGTSMIGEYVEVAYVDDRGELVVERGKVDNVKLLGGVITISVGGEEYDISSIMQILTKEEYEKNPDGDPETDDSIGDKPLIPLEPSKPIPGPVDPIPDPTDPIDPPVGPVDPPGPIDPPVGPTDPTDPPVGPVDPPGPIDPPGEPTDPVNSAKLIPRVVYVDYKDLI